MNKLKTPFCFRGLVSRGFSLVEIILALGITVFVLVILMSLLALGVQTASESRGDSLAVFMADSLRSELITNHDWPGAISTTTPLYVFFTEDGSLTRNGPVPGTPSGDAVYVAELRAWEGNNNAPLNNDGNSRRYRYWESEFIENIHVRFFPLRGAPVGPGNPPREVSLLTQFTITRAMPPN